MDLPLKLAVFGVMVKIIVCKVLVYPTTAPHFKLIAGFGVPVDDLAYENLLIGYVMKASFKLPASAIQLRTHNNLNIKGKRSVNRYNETNPTVFADNVYNSMPMNSTFPEYYDAEQQTNVTKAGPADQHRFTGFRWAVYKGLEAIGDRMGLVGRACVLKSICETAETPFHYHNGIYAEMLHIIFTPSTSVDSLSMHSDNEYLHAEALGKSGAPCDRIFKDCKRSLLDRFSDIYEMTHGFFEKFTK